MNKAYEVKGQYCRELVYEILAQLKKNKLKSKKDP